MRQTIRGVKKAAAEEGTEARGEHQAVLGSYVRHVWLLDYIYTPATGRQGRAQGADAPIRAYNLPRGLSIARTAILVDRTRDHTIPWPADRRRFGTRTPHAFVCNHARAGAHLSGLSASELFFPAVIIFRLMFHALFPCFAIFFSNISSW